MNWNTSRKKVAASRSQGASLLCREKNQVQYALFIGSPHCAILELKTVSRVQLFSVLQVLEFLFVFLLADFAARITLPQNLQGLVLALHLGAAF